MIWIFDRAGAFLSWAFFYGIVCGRLPTGIDNPEMDAPMSALTPNSELIRHRFPTSTEDGPAPHVVRRNVRREAHPQTSLAKIDQWTCTSNQGILYKSEP